MGYLLRVAIESSIITLGLISAIAGYLLPKSALVVVLGGLITVFAVVALVGDVKSHYEDQEDFRIKVVNEATRIVDLIIVNVFVMSSFSRLPCEMWITKSEGFKKDVMGGKDYSVWKQFYDGVDEHNRFCESGRIGWDILKKINRPIFDNFLTIYNSTLWVRELVPRERISEFQDRARQAVTV